MHISCDVSYFYVKWRRYTIPCHYCDVIMGAMASQIPSITIVYSTVHSGASLAYVRGIHRWPVNSPHKWPVTRKMFPFDDVIMHRCHWIYGMNSLVGGLRSIFSEYFGKIWRVFTLLHKWLFGSFVWLATHAIMSSLKEMRVTSERWFQGN